VSKKTQRAELLGLLLQANGGWVGLPEILDLKIAQYNSRIYELRKQRFQIESRTETVDGQRLSWFRLKKGAGPSQAAPQPAAVPQIEPEQMAPLS
jgi:hypothetical protein